MTYRKTSKPPEKTIQGWPHGEVQAAKARKLTPNDIAFEEQISRYEAKDRWGVKMVVVAHVALFILLMAAITVVFAALDRVDQAHRDECVRDGGEVIEIHGARPVGVSEPWMCQR